MRYLILLLLTSTIASASDWPGWRGPTAQGIATDRDLPLDWGGKANTNVLWKMPLPGSDGKLRQDQNQSSPILKKDIVFVTTSYWPAGTKPEDYPEHHVVAFRAGDGKQLWNVKIAPGPWLLKDLRGGYTVPTPAADDERVYVCFGSSVLAALSHAGKELWRKEIIPHDFDVAMASSRRPQLAAACAG